MAGSAFDTLVKLHDRRGRKRTGAVWNAGLQAAPDARPGSPGRRVFGRLKLAEQQAVLALFREHNQRSTSRVLADIERWRTWRDVSYVEATSQVLAMLSSDAVNRAAYRRERDARQRPGIVRREREAAAIRESSNAP